MIESSLSIMRLGPADRPVMHSYYDVCPQSPDGQRVLVTIFENDSIPGLARVGVVDRDGNVLQMIGEPVEVIGHVGRFALWIDNEHIAFRNGIDEAVSGWSMMNLETGQTSEHAGALRQWHAGVGKGLVQYLGDTPNPYRIRQGIRVIDRDGQTIVEVGVRECAAAVPEGTAMPELEKLGVMNFKWSPDGSRFFVVFNTEIYAKNVNPDVLRFKTLISFNADGGDARFLGHFGHHPTWSGDGTCVYAMNVISPEHQRLVAIPADGSMNERVVLEQAPGSHGTFTPDGQYMIIDVPEDEETACAIARFDLKTGERENLARFAHTKWNHKDGNHPHPVVTSDGKRVYFNAQADGRCGCYAMELD